MPGEEQSPRGLDMSGETLRPLRDLNRFCLSENCLGEVGKKKRKLPRGLVGEQGTRACLEGTVRQPWGPRESIMMAQGL